LARSVDVNPPCERTPLETEAVNELNSTVALVSSSSLDRRDCALDDQLCRLFFWRGDCRTATTSPALVDIVAATSRTHATAAQPVICLSSPMTGK
jgi:hypothetical protein